MTHRVAAIDCGTNSVRLLIADTDGETLTDLRREMRIVRLGEGVDRTGRLSEAAIERTRVALVEYAAMIAELGADRIRMCATSASRDAANAADFTAMVRDTLGVEPEVVTGDEEARLSFTGAARGLTAEPPYLVVDIGGGSTEFVVGSTDVEAAISVDVGCVRMTERHLHSDPASTPELAAALVDITGTVDRALAHVGGGRGVTLVGLAGSVTTVTAISLGLDGYDSSRVHHAVVPYADVARVSAELAAADHEERLAIPVMHPGRADVIVAGALILRTIMERTGADSVIASESDILDGIAWSLA
ncbi:hydrolase [Longispora fulva]|uniref:Exopolyphosphatase/guanosine-5'-triphosphate, 3'-diphosphate pyrophosphatase n=1 Tax=Longispora fulva TaxID=619741 RepID=A0A8J7GVC6_9ACTN|nr:Ppx/GppA phosphatase family protein [Longispora fulva]MBG6138958.1 exopolyphosphatase/guanosine-5'-triphosphate,3'-diphosphate pyrophosphatase [Longispora fulva]GIG58451.1 hydrolase [Longispora fulva]